MVECSPDDLDSVYAALSNRARRELVERLATSPGRVTEIAGSFAMSLAGVSKHIGVLEEAGLVHRRIQGREHMLSLAPAPLAGAAAWLSDYRRFWEERLDLLDQRLRQSRKQIEEK